MNSLSPIGAVVSSQPFRRVVFLVAIGLAGPRTLGAPVAIVADTTWTLAGSPYDCPDGLIIHHDATLTVQDGVVVRVGHGQAITVGDQTPGSLAATNARFEGLGTGVWRGFRVGPLSSSVSMGTLALANCHVQQASEHVIWSYRGRTTVTGGTLDISAGNGIWSKGDLEVTGATIQGNGSGIGLSIYQGSRPAVVSGVTFTDLQYGIETNEHVDVSLTTFSDCASAAVRLAAGGLTLGEGNTLTSCPHELEIADTITRDLSLVGDTGVTDAWCPHGLSITNDASVVLKPSNTITMSFGDDTQFVVGSGGAGTLQAENVDFLPASGTGPWNAIEVGDGSHAGTVELTKCRIENTDDWCLNVKTGTVKARQVRFRDSEADRAVRAAPGTSVDVRLCDFGSPSGPSGAGPGTGMEIAGSMQYRPWIVGPFVVDSLDGRRLWSGFSDDPVNTATGNFTLEAEDISIPSRGSPFAFVRYYNSRNDTDGSLGVGWTHTFNLVLSDMTSEIGWIRVQWHDGHADYYAPAGDRYVPVSYGLFDSLTRDEESGQWTISKPDLMHYIFREDGRLIAIEDRNGNRTTLQYADDGRLATVTDPPGRSIAITHFPNGHIESITDWSGRTVGYGYTGSLLTSVNDTLGNDINYTYSNNRLESVVDQRGVRIVYNTYDEHGRVIEQLDGRNNATSFAYDTPNPNETTLTDPLLGESVHRYDDKLRIVGNVDPLGQANASAFDDQGTCCMVADRNGNQTHFEHDLRGNRTRTVNADTGEKRWFFMDARFPDLPTRQIDTLGYVTEWAYDTRGNMLAERRWTDVAQTDYVERTWTYNAWGQMLSETDERDKTTTYAYETSTPGKQGQLLSVTNAEGHTRYFEYDELWRQTAMVDGRGTDIGDVRFRTTYVYDAADRLISETSPPLAGFPEGVTISFGYDQVGNRTSVTDGRGHTATYVFDESRSLTEVHEPLGRTTIYGYDELNRMTSMTDPEGHVWIYEYDAAGRMTKEIAPAPLLFETVYTYDAQGNVVTVTDPTNRVVTHGYDEMNRRIQTEDEAGNVWATGYDLGGRAVRSIDANDYVTEFSYDYEGRLVEVFDAEQGVTAYYYDNAGNLTDVFDASGRWQHRTYDGANRLQAKIDGNGGTWTYAYDEVGNEVSILNPNGFTTVRAYDAANQLVEIDYPRDPTVSYSYDGNGNLTGMADGVGTSVFAYDELNRLTSSVDAYGQTVGYGYDLVGNRTMLTYPDTNVVTYAYDVANRLDTITDWDSRVWDYSFDDAARILELVHPNGVTETRTYDLVGRLDTLSHDKSDGTPVLFYALDYDPQGNPFACTVEGELPPALQTSDVTYAYDDDHRLTSSTDGITYGHDANGNLVSRESVTADITFSYDDADLLIGQSDGEADVSHFYDGQGNRVARAVGEIATRYVLDHSRDMSHVLCEVDANDVIIAHYVHGPMIVGRIREAGDYHCYHTNWIGSVTALTDDTGATTDRYAYSPFGVAVGREGSTPNPFTYVGGLGVMAEADQLSFMRARFYDSHAGRFLSKDPVEGTLDEPQAMNRYAYATGSPTIRVDPDGRAAFLVPFVVIGLHMLADYVYESVSAGRNEDWARSQSGSSGGGSSASGSRPPRYSRTFRMPDGSLMTVYSREPYYDLIPIDEWLVRIKGSGS